MSEIPQLPPVKVAFIIDNEVVDILHTDDRLGAIMLSEPVIKDVTDLVPNKVAVGFIYDPESDSFIPPYPSAPEEDLPAE